MASNRGRVLPLALVILALLAAIVAAPVLLDGDRGPDVEETIEQIGKVLADAVGEREDPGPAEELPGEERTIEESGEVDTAHVERMVEAEVNAIRAERNLSRLGHDRAVAGVARNHSRDMARRGYVGHESPEGDGPQDRMDAAGVDCRAGENIAQTWLDRPIEGGDRITSEEELASALVEMWMDSPDHRENIVSDEYGSHGVGVVHAEDDLVIATHNFCADGWWPFSLTR